MKNKKNDNILKDAINIVYDRSSDKAKEYGPFDESMASKIVYKPQRSWNTVGLTPI